MAGGRFLVNKRELAANQTLFVTNQVSDVDKGSTDVNQLALLLVAHIKLKSVPDRKVDLDLVSSRLPGGVAAVVNDGSLCQELFLAARFTKLNARVSGLLVIAGVFYSHATFDIDSKHNELTVVTIVKALLGYFSLSLLVEHLTSLGDLQ